MVGHYDAALCKGEGLWVSESEATLRLLSCQCDGEIEHGCLCVRARAWVRERACVRERWRARVCACIGERRTDLVSEAYGQINPHLADADPLVDLP